MTNKFIFQIESSSKLGIDSVLIEGRCCAGKIRINDIFTVLYLRGKNPDGSFSVSEIYSIDARVDHVASIRQGVLGLGETGVLTISGVRGVMLPKDSLLEGNSSTQ